MKKYRSKRVEELKNGTSSDRPEDHADLSCSPSYRIEGLGMESSSFLLLQAAAVYANMPVDINQQNSRIKNSFADHDRFRFRIFGWLGGFAVCSPRFQFRS